MFMTKCAECGKQYARNLSRCPFCASTGLVPPVNSTEGDNAVTIGNLVIAFSIIGAVVGVFYISSSQSNALSELMTVIFLASGINGAFFGYLLTKVGGILRRMDAQRP